MVNRCGNSGNRDDFIFLGSKITVDGDCSHKRKRHLHFGRKATTNDCNKYVRVKSVWFSPLNLSNINLIIKSAKEPRKEVFSALSEYFIPSYCQAIFYCWLYYTL